MTSPRYVNVLLALPFSELFTYEIPPSETVEVGSYVQVSFGKRTAFGVVWQTLDSPTVPLEKIKPLFRVFAFPPCPESLRDLIEWVASYTLTPKGLVLKLCMGNIPLFKLKKTLAPLPASSYNPLSASVHPDHTPAQKEACSGLISLVDAHGFSVSVLDGVTGSGKTQVYFSLIEHILTSSSFPGAQILVLLPEISLSSEWVKRYQAWFDKTPCLWHSGISGKNRSLGWLGVAAGTIQVVVGARSALFLPFKNLQYIIVDEEHDSSYKQEEGVFYNARDMAIVRAKIENISVLLASATPSLETRLNIKNSKYHCFSLPERPGTASLPTISAINLSTYAKQMHSQKKTEGVSALISPPLREALSQNLENECQSLLFLNRRGYSPLVLCQGCGHRLGCPNCTSSLVFHKTASKLMCHHCLYTVPTPSLCPGCGKADTLAPWGGGVERVAEEVARVFPEARVCLLSSDTLNTPDLIEHTLHSILNQEVDILIGTQLIAKGHHFPKLTLVGVIDADLGLSGGDLRASERTYQMLHQVAGRSGREKTKGHVYLQTFSPDHHVIHALLSGNRDLFMKEEEEARRQAMMPPFGKLAALILTSMHQAQGEAFAKHLSRNSPTVEGIHVWGPAPAPLFQIGKRFRWRFLLKATQTAPLHRFIRHWLELCPPPYTVKLHVDIDPYSFL